MALEKLCLEALVKMDDGRIREAFEQALKRCEDDCRDRPMLKKDRTVTLEAKIVPVADEEGALVECLLQLQVKDQRPVRSSKVYHMSAARQGLWLNELSPDDARQMTIDGPELQAVPEKEVADAR